LKVTLYVLIAPDPADELVDATGPVEELLAEVVALVLDAALGPLAAET